MEETMKIKFFSINPKIIYKTENKIYKIEKIINTNIEKYKEKIKDYNEEILITNLFCDTKDEEIDNYINQIREIIKKYERREKTAQKRLKKLKKKQRYINLIKKMT